MKRFIFTMISSCVMLFAAAQEEIALDSIRNNQKDFDTRQMILLRPTLSDDTFTLDKISLFDQSIFRRPLLPNYSKNLDFSKYRNSALISSESFSVNSFGFSPFWANGFVFNQATYRLNDRISIGGNSFGAQSVFDQPRLNSSMQNMSTKGASMFMQYKVSKSFKVETRISISNHQSPWEP
jgi:hypothetical protein